MGIKKSTFLHKKARTFVFDLFFFFAVSMLLGHRSYIVGKLVYFLFLQVIWQSWVCRLHSWKPSLPMPNSLFCYWLVFGVICWFTELKSDKTIHTGNLTIYSFNKQGPQWHVEEPYTAIGTFRSWSSAAWSHTLDGILFFNQYLSQVSY